MEGKEKMHEANVVAPVVNEGKNDGDKAISSKVGDAGEGSSGGNERAVGVTYGVSGTCSSVRVRPIPAFLQKVYDMVEDPETNYIISWNTTGSSFIVWDHHRCAAEILNKYFRHNNFTSFQCQLNTYGFKKINWERLEFQNEWFQKGNKDWLKNIRRRNQHYFKNLQQSEATKSEAEMGMNEVKKESEYLSYEHVALKVELKKLQESQDDEEKEMAILKQQALFSVSKQKKIIKFLSETILSLKNDPCSCDVAKKQRLEEVLSSEELMELMGHGETSKSDQGNLVSTQTNENNELLIVDSSTSASEEEKNTIVETSRSRFGNEDYFLLEKKLMEDMSFGNEHKEEITKLQSQMVIELEDLWEILYYG